ncbi:MAG: ornithine cyclodeaminase family protein [Chloroflexi bacterium]|nr:ornithine cyclodeaminase family protein [Chloroflexota bacterium]
MSTLYVDEEQVQALLTMESCIEALEDAFQQLGSGRATNQPRQRVRIPGAALAVMPAGHGGRGYMGYKAYTSARAGTRFKVFLYGDDGDLKAILGANALGQVRTGAASALATRYLARPESTRVAVIGTGTQARTQVEGVCAVLPVREVRAYSRDAGRRQDFARQMGQHLGVDVLPAHSAEEAVRGADVVITITNTRDPVLRGEWLPPGCHINAAGSNYADRRELDEEAVRRSDVIVVDALDQAHIECGDLLAPEARGAFDWAEVHALADVVAGRATGRSRPDQVTLFESQGLAIEDIATAAWVYETARERGMGVELPLA